MIKLNRRNFLVGTGVLGLTGVTAGGLVLTQTATGLKVLNKIHDKLDTPQTKTHLFVQIQINNQITIVAHRTEMGQGTKTSLAQIIAEELDADWQRVNVIQAPADKDYGDQNTDTSKSVRSFYNTMRRIGANMNFMLRQAAAKQWQVDIDQIRTENSWLINKLDGRKLAFGSVAEAAAKLPIPNQDQIIFKRPEDYKFIGQPIKPVDQLDIVKGSATYAMDFSLPNMVFASIERAPVIGSKLTQSNFADVKKIPGILDVFELPATSSPVGFKPLNGVVIVAKDTWSTFKGREALKCQWSKVANSEYDSESLAQELKTNVSQPGAIARKNGDVDAQMNRSSEFIDATYSMPYQAHAPMEPPVAIAEYKNGGCEVWAGVQSPQSAANTIAQAVKLPAYKVKVNVLLTGGAFGRKSKPDFCAEAAVVAKRVGKPVKLIWRREDDVQFDYYHAQSAQYFKAGFDENKQITAWLQRSAFPSMQTTFQSNVDGPTLGELGMGFVNTLYNIEHFQAESQKAKPGVRIGWLRSVCNIHHGFGHNCFADEVAHHRGMDPVKHLLELYGPDRQIDPEKVGFKFRHSQEKYPLDNRRIKNVITTVANASGFGPLSNGEGWGIAAHYSFLSYAAVATRVKVIGKSLKIEEVHIAIDCGQVVNPDRVKAQMEGSVVFGLTLALFGKIEIKEGEVQQSNFHNYPLLRINQCPDIKVHIIASDMAPTGVGEPGVPPVAPSLINAIFAASGQRIRDLPVSDYYSI